MTSNDWVEDGPHGRSRNLLLPPSVKPDTRLMVTDAGYFKAPYCAGYGEATGVTVLERGLRGRRAAMVVRIPNERGGLACPEDGRDAAGSVACWRLPHRKRSTSGGRSSGSSSGSSWPGPRR